MAKPVDWHGANKILTAPKGESDRVTQLHVFNNGHMSVSCWELTEQEIIEIVQTKKIFLSVWFGGSQPPVFVGSEEAVRSIALDFGKVWNKNG